MSRYEFDLTLVTPVTYKPNIESSISLVVNTLLDSLLPDVDYRVAHGIDDELGYFIDVRDDDSLIVSVSSRNNAWIGVYHYAFLAAIRAPDKSKWCAAAFDEPY